MLPFQLRYTSSILHERATSKGGYRSSREGGLRGALVRVGKGNHEHAKGKMVVA